MLVSNLPSWLGHQEGAREAPALPPKLRLKVKQPTVGGPVPTGSVPSAAGPKIRFGASKGPGEVPQLDGAYDRSSDTCTADGPHRDPSWIQGPEFQDTARASMPVGPPYHEPKGMPAYELAYVGRDVPTGPLEGDHAAVVPSCCTAGMTMPRHHSTGPAQFSLGHCRAERGQCGGSVCGTLAENCAAGSERRCGVVLYGTWTVPQVDGASDPAEAWEKLGPPASGLTHGRFTAGPSPHGPSDRPSKAAGAPWATIEGEMDQELVKEEDEAAKEATPSSNHGDGEEPEESSGFLTPIRGVADGRATPFSQWECEGLPILAQGMRLSLATAEGGRGVPDSVPDPHVSPTPTFHLPTRLYAWDGVLGIARTDVAGLSLAVSVLRGRQSPAG